MVTACQVLWFSVALCIQAVYFCGFKVLIRVTLPKAASWPGHRVD